MFLPPRRRGLLIQSAAAFFLLSAGLAFIFLAFTFPVGAGFAVLSLLGLILLAPLPLLGYRIYSLAAGKYTIERDGLRLNWGMRVEDIPILEIEWVRPAVDLVLPLPLPRLRWPGSLVGHSEVPDLGPVEFLAAESDTLLLVATPLKVYAISPADPSAFLKEFRRTIEMGSLEALPPRSQRGSAMLSGVWFDLGARSLGIAGLSLSLLVFLAVGLGIGSRAQIRLGFGPDRQPLDLVPAVQALLLPFLAVASFGLDLLLGLFFYRREERRPLAYFLWIGGVLTPLILLIAAWFIL